MRLFEITMRPQSGFGTPLKGDTLWGHFCWQAAHDPGLVDGGLERQLECYMERPFLVVSSAFPRFTVGQRTFYALKRPELPLSFFIDTRNADRLARMEGAKELKDRKWVLLEKGGLFLNLTRGSLMSEEDVLSYADKQSSPARRRQMQKLHGVRFSAAVDEPHNTINRLTSSTGTGFFAPYTQEVLHYYPETVLALFVLLDDSVTDIARVRSAFERVGGYGYGKNASIGTGRFAIGDVNEVAFPSEEFEGHALYTLGPCVPERETYEKIYFKPFIRYGKHGDLLAKSANPFKNPVVMADEGAVLFPRRTGKLQRPFVGRSVTGVSKSMPNTVVQGYAPYIPLKLEGANE